MNSDLLKDMQDLKHRGLIEAVTRPDGNTGWGLTELAMREQDERLTHAARVRANLSDAQCRALLFTIQSGASFPSRATIAALQAKGLVDASHWYAGNRLNLTELGLDVAEGLIEVAS